MELTSEDVNRIHSRLDNMVEYMNRMNLAIAKIHSDPCKDLLLLKRDVDQHQKEHDTQKLEAQQVKAITLSGAMRVGAAIIIGVGGILWALVSSGALSKFLGG